MQDLAFFASIALVAVSAVGLLLSSAPAIKRRERKRREQDERRKASQSEKYRREWAEPLEALEGFTLAASEFRALFYALRDADSLPDDWRGNLEAKWQAAIGGAGGLHERYRADAEKMMRRFAGAGSGEKPLADWSADAASLQDFLMYTSSECREIRRKSGL